MIWRKISLAAVMPLAADAFRVAEHATLEGTSNTSTLKMRIFLSRFIDIHKEQYGYAPSRRVILFAKEAAMILAKEDKERRNMMRMLSEVFEVIARAVYVYKEEHKR